MGFKLTKNQFDEIFNRVVRGDYSREDGKELLKHIETIEQELRESREALSESRESEEEISDNYQSNDRKLKGEIASLKEMNSLQLATINEKNNELNLANEKIESLMQTNAKLDRENQILMDTPAGEVQRLADATEKVLLADNERLLEVIADLNRQREGLIIAPKKVVLPKDVADALDECYNHDEDADAIICELLDMSHQSRTYPERFRTLRSFGFDRGYDLAAALVRGYVVEQTQEEKLLNGINSIYDNWVNEPAGETTSAADADNLVKRIADFVIKFIDKK